MIGKMWGSELIPARTEFLESGDIGIETILPGNREDGPNSDKNIYVDLTALQSTPWASDSGCNVNIYYQEGYGTLTPSNIPWMDIEDAWDEEEEADDEEDDDDDEEEEDEDLFEDDEDEFDEFDDDDDDDDEEADEEE